MSIQYGVLQICVGEVAFLLEKNDQNEANISTLALKYHVLECLERWNQCYIKLSKNDVFTPQSKYLLILVELFWWYV